MRVTLAGLPDASTMTAPPRVIVTRGNYRRTISHSRRLGHLKPGTYTLTAEPVYTRDGGRFIAPSQTIRVRRKARARLTYAPTPQQAGVATWNILLLVVRNTDTDYVDGAGATRHLRASLPDEDIAALHTAMTSSIPQAVTTWSNGQVSWNVEIQQTDTPITGLSSDGSNAQWVAPRNVSAAISQYFRPGYHDEVMVYWRGSDDSGNSIPTAGWGLAQLQRKPDYGYAAVSYLGPGTWNSASADMPTQIWIHEWLHTVGTFYAELGYDIPVGDADGATSAGYVAEQPPYPGWGTYYSALMTANVAQGGRLTGIPTGAWRRGSIRNWGREASQTLGGISIADACTQQHGAGTTAHYRDFNDPYSWYCGSTNPPYESVGGVDMDAACFARYGAGATAALSERTAYGWFCRR